MPLRTIDYSRKLDALRILIGRCMNKLCRGRGKGGLEFAHLKPTRLSGYNGRGLRERYLDIVRHPSCYTLVCHQCHRKMDNPANKEPWEVESLKSLPIFANTVEVDDGMEERES